MERLSFQICKSQQSNFQYIPKHHSIENHLDLNLRNRKEKSFYSYLVDRDGYFFNPSNTIYLADQRFFCSFLGFLQRPSLRFF